MTSSEDFNRVPWRRLNARAFMGSQLPQPQGNIPSTPTGLTVSNKQKTAINGPPGLSAGPSHLSISIVPQQPIQSLKRRAPNSTTEGPNKKSKCAPKPKNTKLCKDCVQIDFQAVLRLDATTLQSNLQQGVFVANLGRRICPNAHQRCSLCRLFSQVRIIGQGMDENVEYHLRAYSAFNCFNGMILQSCPKRLAQKDLPCLAVVSTSSTTTPIPDSNILFLFCHSENDERARIFTPRLIGPEVDFVKLKEMMEYCKTKHHHLCSTHRPVEFGLKLIDCSKKAEKLSDLKITSVPSPCPPYLALSYVWGSHRHDRHQSEPSQNDLIPKTIIDAIKATRRLGYRFLWVDKYCINQHNERESHFEINRMDRIYQGAEVTLMMTAGQDSDAGLAGISKGSRNSQQSLLIGDIRVTSSMHVPMETIRLSELYSRAWTLQEGFLSRRRFMFTAHEVYFECRSMRWRESWTADMDELHSHGRVRKFFRPGIYSGNLMGNNGTVARSATTNLKRYDFLASEYSTKRFSKDFGETDALRAFQGIMNYMSSGKVPIHQVWGVPFIHSKNDHVATQETFVTSMLWEHKITPLSRQGSPKRRPEFPSWCWPAWEGAIRFPTRSRCTGSLHEALARNVCLEVPLNDEEVVEMPLVLYASMIKQPNFREPRVLSFSADRLLQKDLMFSVKTPKGHGNTPHITLGESGFTAAICVSACNFTRWNFRTFFKSRKYKFPLLMAESNRKQRQHDFLRFLIIERVYDLDTHKDTSAKKINAKQFLYQRVGTLIVKTDLESFKEKFALRRCKFRLC